MLEFSKTAGHHYQHHQGGGSSGGTKISTINEKKVPLGKKQQSFRFKNLNEVSRPVRLPVLPSLAEATSVRQKWIILLSKAKGGVEKIPKAFLNSLDSTTTTTNSAPKSLIAAATSTALAIPSLTSEFQSTKLKIPGKKQSSFKSPNSQQIEENNLIRMPSSRDLDEISTNVNDAAEAYFEIFDQHETNAVKQQRFQSNPKQILGTLIELRRELKNENESMNAKIEKNRQENIRNVADNFVRRS